MLREGPQDFPPVPELDRWSRGIPPAEIAQARARWESLCAEVKAGADASRVRALVRLSIQLGGELELPARRDLFARAAEQTTDPNARTTLAASAANAAVRLGNLDAARLHLQSCVPATELVADSAHRIALALLALSEGRPAEAIALLGRAEGDLPILISYGRVAAELRDRALVATGEASASATVREWRAEERFTGTLMMLAGAVVVFGGLAMGAATALDPSARDAWFVLLAATPFLLVVGIWLLFSGSRRRRIATGGIAGEGRVAGKTRRPLESTARGNAYALEIAAELRDGEGHAHTVFARTLSTYGHEADELVDRRVLLLWHPAHPHRTLIRLLPR